MIAPAHTKPLLVDQFGQPMAPVAVERRARAMRALKARYDAATTNDDNRRHWANADSLSASAAASPAVRKKLRDRCRYETANNPLLNGIAQTLANDIIGQGPVLQVLTRDSEANRRIEQSFNRWSRRVRLAAKLRTMRMQRPSGGEAFLQAITNERLTTAVKLDLEAVETDQIATPYADLSSLTDPNKIDGIDYDSDGNPIRYWKLREHPGTDRPIAGGRMIADAVDARQMIHWFREDRPNQRRGIPEITPALPLFAQLRRFALATIAAAETAAEFAGVMYTDAPGESDPDDVEAMDAIELEMRAMLTLPAGWKMGQVKAEHPATTYEMFRSAVIEDVARCLLMPISKARGNAQGYNFTAGKLERDAYLDAVEVDRDDCEVCVLDPVLMWYLDEAALIPGELPENIGFLDELPHRWIWPPHRESDPHRQAQADRVYWEMGIATDEELLLRRGVDPDEWNDSQQRSLARRRRLGLPLPGESDRQPEPAETMEDD